MATPATIYDESKRTRREQVEYVVPTLTIKDLLSAIPAHCHKRSLLRSSSYVVWDCFLWFVIYKATVTADAYVPRLELPHPALYPALRVALWAAYSFAAGLVATGLWVVAHECGHQAFSESKFINNTVGWILHSALGVPYHSWRISHAKHHASTGHVTLDQVFVPKTRSELGLPAFDHAGEELSGASVTDKVKAELYEAIGDSPIGAVVGCASYLLLGWPLYITNNTSGQHAYPKGTSHFVCAQPLYTAQQHRQILVSVLGVALWMAALGVWTATRGFAEMFRVYFVVYLWVNHWLVLITFLQHTDPLLPHYRAPAFTFARGALCTFDRQLLGGLGSVAGWIGASATHGISETHVLHHVCSKIPHYHAWEAADALRARLRAAGVQTAGRPGGWGEVYRVYRECKFIEDEGNVVFYKNGHGLAAARASFPDAGVSDSGVDVS